MEKINKLEEEYSITLKEMEEKVQFIENFLIHNTRGYYLRALKKL